MKNYLAVCIFAALAVFFVAERAEAGPHPTLQFGCGFVKTAKIDPMFPDMTPHVHDFFGNLGVNKDSTIKTLSQDRRTSCRFDWYTSSHWSVAIHEGGKILKPFRSDIYYQGVRDQSSLKNIPRGAQMKGTRVDYRCGMEKPVTSVPYGCTEPLFRVRIHYQDCHDQKGVRPENFTYSEKWVCPPGSVRIPRSWLAVHYKNEDGIQKPLWVHGGDKWVGAQNMHGNLMSAPQLKFYDEIERCVINAPDYSTRTGCQPNFK